ncbi:trypsin-like peptidase domain-containing protein [Cellulomonas sp. DKR-3]|uniref:Trypsin-like peptidase domain-containing protein n=1 Tax=Cellulomonas fulva TaxID=2835530 RepID=A0ABS5TYL1_9CELL|nr:trypsin-like peptidase domain-containing protein [Cellulomonas fulva]MBT0994234.1 trypsin-like peptidase domain-containing protein [Cellulomonas fulva]
MTTPAPENHPQAAPTEPLSPVPAPPATPAPAAATQPHEPVAATQQMAAQPPSTPTYAQPYGPGGAAPAQTPAQTHAQTPAHAPAGYGHAFGAPQPQQAPPAPPQGPWGFAAEGAPAPQPVRGERKRRIWIPVTAAAASALVLGAAAVGVAYGLDEDGPSAGTASGSSFADLGQTSTDTVPVSGSNSDAPDWEAVAAAVQPSVVAIQTTTQSGSALGSGVVIDDAGHVVTNNHVVAGAQDDQVQVTLSDGRIFTADVVGTDPTTDLAVIKLVDPPQDLSPAALGSSADVNVGESVMAVGNPLGLQSTVTTGIVSALDRPVTTQGEDGSSTTVTNAIQVDASVNPGNSGGPLFDAQGRVIGINSSIATLSSESGSIGLGFAIPVDLVKNIAGQLIDDGTAEHAFLGVGLNDGTATVDGVTRAGAVVEQVSDGSPAAKAGLENGDVIVGIDGDAVGGAESLTAYVRSYASGTKVQLTVVRDGASKDIEVTLATKEDTATSQGDQGQGTLPGQGDQGQGTVPDQGQGDQGQGDQGQGDSQGQQMPDLQNMTPEELWQWLQEHQGEQG